MKFSYDWIQTYFDKPLPKPDKLAEILTTHSFEAEVGDNDVLEIDILPNRAPDCSSHIGIAKEISAILGRKLKVHDYEMKKDPNLRTEDYIAIKVEDKKSCPRYVGLLLKDVKVGPSPKWLKDRLSDIDQKSINNVVDIMNYVMLETGQPLHAFDLNKIEKRKIVVRKSIGGEKIETLDDKKISPPLGALVISDDKSPLAIAGIKGGKRAEIKKDTKDVLIEAAVFNGPSIRSTSRAINMQTDSSYRFEHGVSFSLPEFAIKRAAALVQELAGGVAAELLDVSTGEPRKNPIIFNTKDVSKILGRDMDDKKIEKILQDLGFILEKEKNNYFATPPKERLDINTKEDIVEEIIRIYGYKKIKSEIPKIFTAKNDVDEEYIYSNWVRGVLSELGFTEVRNYSFAKAGKKEIKNPQSSEKKYLRASLLPGLKFNTVENFKNFDEVKLFEIGKTFHLKGKEVTSIAVAIGRKKNKKDIEAELRGAADSLFLENVKIKDNMFEVGIGQIIDASKDKGIDLTKIHGFSNGGVEYKPFSRFPVVERDISIFVPMDVRIEEVADVIENTAGKLLVDSDLFDEYTPPSSEQKSYAFRLVFQSFDKTLTDKEVNEIMNKIISALEENKLWQVRR